MTDFPARHEYTENEKELVIQKTHRYRVWAAKNAYLLGTIAVMFAVTWLYILLLFVFYGMPRNG